MTELVNKLLERVEVSLDRFFGGAVSGLYGLLDRAFEYTYRETKAGIFGLFSEPDKLRQAARAARDRGYTNFDCLTPFPLHGLEFDMGLRRSKVPYITFFAGLTGVITAFLMQWSVHEQVVPQLFRYFDIFPNLRSYPLNIGGKPSYSWPAMIPICFELTVLLGGHTTVIGLLLLGRIPKASRKILHPEITNDRFCLWIPTDSAGYNEANARQLLTEFGATDITVVTEGQS